MKRKGIISKLNEKPSDGNRERLKFTEDVEERLLASVGEPSVWYVFVKALEDGGAVLVYLGQAEENVS